MTQILYGESYLRVCQLCKGRFPLEQGQKPRTDLDLDELMLEYEPGAERGLPWMDGSHLRCIGRKLQELAQKEPMKQGPLINLHDLHVVRRGLVTGTPERRPLSDREIYRISQIGTRRAYVDKGKVLPSRLLYAMQAAKAADRKREQSELHRLLEKRMRIDPEKDVDLYQDLKNCFLAAIERNDDHFKIFFTYIAKQPETFSAPLLNSALAKSADAPNILIFLVKNYANYSSIAICVALKRLCSADHLQEEEICASAEELCLLQRELHTDDLSPVVQFILGDQMYRHPGTKCRLLHILDKKMAEKLRLDTINKCALHRNRDMLEIFLSSANAKVLLGKAILHAINHQIKDLTLTVEKLLDQRAISREDRGQAIVAALRRRIWSDEMNFAGTDTALFLARGGPFSASHMEEALRCAVMQQWSVPLTSFLADDVLQNVEDRAPDQYYWDEALRESNRLGRLGYIKELLTSRLFAFPLVEESIITVCASKPFTKRKMVDHIPILLELLCKKLPSGGLLTSAVWLAAIPRYEIFKVVFLDYKAQPERWESLEGKRGEILNKIIEIPPHWPKQGLRTLQFFLDEEGPHISAPERASAFASAIAKGRPEVLEILLDDHTKRGFAISDKEKSDALLLFASASVLYAEPVQALLRVPLDNSTSRSPVYWEMVVGPALKRAIRNKDVKMVEILLESGKISSRMKLEMYREVREPLIIAALRATKPIYNRKLDFFKIFFMEMSMRWASFWRSRCWWRS
jgi:hypothetical protein